VWDVFVENFATSSRSIDKSESMVDSDPDNSGILGENSTVNKNVDGKEGCHTRVANRSIANETGRTFMRCCLVLSEALWYTIAVVTMKSAKKKPVDEHHGVSRDEFTISCWTSFRTYHRETLSNTVKQIELAPMRMLLKSP
jgi:hypothetical protein